MLHMAYCDDERAALALYPDQIRAMFQSRGCPVTMELYEGIEQLLDQIVSGKQYDVLFLDIDMPGLNGIEGGKKLRELSRESLIVYVSFHEQYVFDTFQVRPFRFIRKSLFLHDLEDAAPDLVQALLHQDEEVLVSVGKQVHVLVPNRIVYIESNAKLLDIHMQRSVLQIRYKMMDMQDKLEQYGFVRVHKGYLVNVRFIECVNADEVILHSGQAIPLSKHRKLQVIEKLEGLL